jgi:hypothetical protein
MSPVISTPIEKLAEMSGLNTSRISAYAELQQSQGAGWSMNALAQLVIDYRNEYRCWPESFQKFLSAEKPRTYSYKQTR